MSSGQFSGGPLSFFFLLYVTLAYGNYNDMVLDASGIRGQSVIIWDFEWAYSSLYVFLCMLTAVIFFSSQDSLGASAQTSKDLYNNVANQHPSNILTLNHETIGSSAFIHLVFLTF